MVLPPNRIGGARGDDGRTLTDLYNQLVLVQASLTGIGERLATLMEPDPTVVVNGFEWEGLRRALLYMQSIQTSTFNAADQGAAYALDIRGWLGYHLGATGAEGAVQPGGQAAPAKLFQSAIDTVAALTSPNDENTFSRLGSIRDNSLAILQAIGSLPGTPAGETVKTLLAALVACCEEGAGEPTDPTQNPAPDGFCAGSTRLRNTGWEDLGSGGTIGGTPVNVWRPTFDYNSPVIAPADGYSPAGEPQSLLVPSGTNVRVCGSWDFTSQAAPLGIGREIGAVNSVINGSIFTASPFTSGELVIGGIADDVDRCASPDGRLWLLNFAFATGTTPTRNVWLGVVDLGCEPA